MWLILFVLFLLLVLLTIGLPKDPGDWQPPMVD